LADAAAEVHAIRGDGNMANTIKVRTKVSGGVTDVKSLMLHPMETGTRTDADTGELVPAHYITQLKFANNGKLIMVANFSTAVSRDPYFSFKFTGGNVGDTLTVNWVDNFGNSDEFESVLE
jgi:sulfur-oxidizing protein SoxZ